MDQEHVRILLVEENETGRMAIEQLVTEEDLPYELVAAQTVAAAVALLASGGVDLALIDYRLPDGTGLEVQARAGGTPCIFVTGSADRAMAAEVFSSGACDLIVKDHGQDYLHLLPEKIHATLERRRMEEELWEYRSRLEELVEERTAELRQSEEKFRLAMDATDDGLWNWDVKSGRVTYSSGWGRILGYAPSEIGAEYGFWESRIHPEDRVATLGLLNAHLDGRRPSFEAEHRLRTKEGEYKWVLGRGRAVERDAGGAVLRMVGTMTDISERVQVESQRDTALERLQKLTHDLGERVKELNCLYSISTLVETPNISLDEIVQGIVDLMPPAWQYPEIACARIILEGQEFSAARFAESAWQQTADIIVHGERVGTVQLCYREQRSEGESEGPFSQGERELIQAIAKRLGRIIERFRAGFQRDATLESLRQAQSELVQYAQDLERMVADKVRELELERAKVIQTAKLAALGEMAAGMAHELNQPLTAMLFEADYLKSIAQKPDFWQKLGFSDELSQMGENLKGDVDRARRIIDHLRTFSRTSKREPDSVNLNRPIEEGFILVGEQLREHGVEVALQLEPELPPILGDSNRLEQVFLNLISNAEYALGEMKRRVRENEVERPGYQKKLTISTKFIPPPLAGGALAGWHRLGGAGQRLWHPTGRSGAPL